MKHIIHSFLDGKAWESPKVSENSLLRDKIANEVSTWGTNISTRVTTQLLNNACNMAEYAYSHTSFEHQYFVALSTVFTFYADDHCTTNPEPIGQFAQRIIDNQPQLDPVLDRFVVLLKTSYDLWPRIAANAIVSGAMDTMTGMYIEYTTKDMSSRRGATRYPLYLRTRAGFGPPYAHYVFPSEWRNTVNSYIQIIPSVSPET